MQRNKSVKAVLFAAAALAGSIALAAEPTQPAPSMQGRGDMSMHHPMKEPGGAMGGDMKGMMGGGGMMGMMRSCHAMMEKKGMAGAPAMPQLPPGNEKLEFQMHAEMMQKIGEIALKYADRIKEN